MLFSPLTRVAPLFAALLCLVAGCQTGGGAGDSTPLTRRYETRKKKPVKSDSMIYLSAGVSRPASATATPSMLRLAGEGQAAVVEAAGGKGKEMKEALESLFPKAAPSLDRTRVETELVVTHLQTSEILQEPEGSPIELSPADRIATLELSLKPASENLFTFHSWNRFETVFGQLELGEITRTGKRSFNASLEPTFGGTLVGVGALGLATETTNEEKLKLKDRVLGLSGWLTDTEGRLLLQGGPGRDLEGNTSVKLTIQLPGSEVEITRLELLKGDGTYRDSTEVGVRYAKAKVPFAGCGEDVRLLVGADYTFRHVTAADSTLSEGDDHVVEYYGWAPDAGAYHEFEDGTVAEKFYTSLKLMDAKALERRARTYPVFVADEPVYLERVGESHPLVFATEGEYLAFQRWSQQKVGPAGLNGVTFGTKDNEWTARANASGGGVPAPSPVLVVPEMFSPELFDATQSVPLE